MATFTLKTNNNASTILTKTIESGYRVQLTNGSIHYQKTSDITDSVLLFDLVKCSYLGLTATANKTTADSGKGLNDNTTLATTSNVTLYVVGSEKAVSLANLQVFALGLQGGSNNIQFLTQAEYDALVSAGTVDPSTIYYTY